MPPTITGLTYGTVTFRVAQLIADSADAGADPDVAGITGTVNISANADNVILATGSTPPVTLFDGPYVFNITDGVMQDGSGNTAVELVATDCAVLNPINFTYHVKFIINNNGNLKRGEFDFSLPTGSAIDLTSVSPVPGTTGTPVTQGPAGPAPVYSGTSATSTTIGTGSKTFATQSGANYFSGQFVRLASNANGTNYMAGNITSYSGSTLVVNVTETGGSGTFADWNISLTGVKGATGPQGSTGNTGPAPTVSGTSATSFTPGTGSKVFTTQSGIAFVVGEYVRIASAGTPADFMSGPITAYSGTSLTVNVDTFSGTTAHTDWNISISGATGPQGPQGSPGAGAPNATTTSTGSVQLAGDLGGTATAPTVTGGTHHGHTASQISDSTTVGRSVLTAADAPTARTAIGAGTGNGNVTGTGGITTITQITAAAYAALGTKDSATLYVIVG